jgi:hypothetical protein
MTEKLSQMLKEGDDTDNPAYKISPKGVVDLLVKHCIALTAKSRDFSENNKDKRLPHNYVDYPGTPSPHSNSPLLSPALLLLATSLSLLPSLILP